MPKLKKPKWGKPKLIILTRGKPEERVLLACKNYDGGAAYGSTYDFCDAKVCPAGCSALEGS